MAMILRNSFLTNSMLGIHLVIIEIYKYENATRLKSIQQCNLDDVLSMIEFHYSLFVNKQSSVYSTDSLYNVPLLRCTSGSTTKPMANVNLHVGPNVLYRKARLPGII